MKSKNILMASLVLLSLFFVSCKKDSHNNNDNKDDNKDPYSTLTVEENKANIEQSGIAMLNIVKELEGTATIDAAASMKDYMERSDIFAGNPNMNTPAKKSQFNSYIKPVIIASNCKKFSPKQVAKELSPNLSEETLLSIYNDVKGVYTWNSQTESWSFSATGNEIRMEFPSTETGTTNNVVFRVYDFTYATGPFTWMGDYTGEMPTQIKSELTVNSNVLLSYILTIAYGGTDKKPSSISTTLTLSPFAFTVEASNTDNTDASFSFKWTKDGETLVLLSLAANGNWTEDNLNNQSNEIGDYIYTGNATFQVMNFKLTGNVDVKTINDQMNAIDPALADSSKAAKKCEIINANAKLSLCYADNNLIIANVIASPVKKTDSYYDWVYNPQTQQYQEILVTETYYDVSLNFQFKDASTVDMDTYFNSGFESLIDQAEQYMTDLQEKYNIN